MSTQLKEKQQTKSKEQIPARDLQADFHFNQHIFRTIAYTAAGFGLGMVSSLLFKHKAGMTIFFAGAGAGYGSAGFVNELQNFRNKRNPTEITRRQGGPSQFERTTDSLKGDLQQAKNKVERGVENVEGKIADQVSQTARGAEEWARNASEKAQQHFQGKDYRRGGDDDKDDDKSKKRDQTDQRREQRDQRRDTDTQKKDLKDQKKEVESQKKDQPEQKKDQKEQKKEAGSQKKDQPEQKKDQKDQKKEGGSERSGKEANATLKGGLSERAKREEGSKEHRLIGDIRADQYTAKIPDQNAFAGYDSPKQQWEGMNIKREDQSKGGQDKTAADVNRTYNKEGQHFQDFRSNPNEVGQAGEISDIKKDYQRNRNQAQNEEMDNRRRASKHAEQDLHGQTRKQGNIHRVNVESETKQGFQNYQTGVAPGLKRNQVNADL